jgi:hypothetical protein
MKRIIHAISFYALLVNSASAQPFNLDPAIEPGELKFTEHYKSGNDKADGRISLNALTQLTDTAYYFIGGMSMYAPTTVSIRSQNDSSNIKIALFKENWKAVLKSGEIKPTAPWETTFKTEGDMGIRVITDKKPTDYTLMIYTANDIDFEVPTAFTKKKVEGSNFINWIKKNALLVGAAVIILILLFLVLRKRGRQSRPLMLAILMLLWQVVAHAQENGPTGTGEAGIASRVNTFMQREVTDDDREWAENNIDRLNTIITNGRDAYEAWNTLTTLNPGECSPDFQTSPQAMMPSVCDGNPDCSACFRNAARELNFVRRQLARLNCIYNNTKTYTAAALSFGDNVSGIHGMMGLSWQSQRPGIVQAMESMKGACKEKYTGMMGSLERVLRRIDDCERQYGMPDWYQRSGFIYYEFMKEKYKITD